MSIENLKEYARRCAADPALRSKAKAIGLSDLDGQIANSKSLGLDWTKDEFAAFTKEMQADGELSEKDLENVAGGIVSATAAVVAGVVGAAAGVVGAGAAVAATTTGGGW